MRPALILRSLVGSFGYILDVLAVKYISLGIFTSILNSYVFITVILSYVFIGDRILPLEGLAMVGAFSGIVILSVA